MEILRSKNIQKAIVLIKILDDKKLLVVDNDTTIRMLHLDDLSNEGGFKVNVHHQRYKSSVVAFSNDGEYFATLSSDVKESRLYNAKRKKLLSRVDRHHGEVSCVGIDPLSRYMFSCGDDGKSFAYDTKSGKLIFTLPVHVDTVNDIAFSENSNWVATCSYDKKISLFSLVTMAPTDKLKAHAAPVMKLRFIGKSRLVSVDKNSSVIIWDIYTHKVIERLQGVHDEVLQITSTSDEKFLFLGTSLGYILVYDLTTYELLAPRYIKLSSPITALEFDNEAQHLIIGTKDGVLMYYDIYEGVYELKSLLREKKYIDIEAKIVDNPILAYTQIYELVSNLWENTLSQAKIALQNGDKKKALLLFKQFINIPSKNRIMQKVIKDYEEFEKFMMFAKQGKLQLAYSLANSFPIYKESKLYQSLEARWQKTFTQAQKHALNPKGTDTAKELLSPYRGISEKTALIQDLLTQGEVYKRFRIAIGQKDFKLCFELIKQHKFLKEFTEYNTIMNYADTLYIKAKGFLEEGDTHSAIKLLRVLADFDDFKDEVKELMINIELKQKFFKAIEEEDITTAYNMLAKAEELLETQDAQTLQEKWNSDLRTANIYAVEGDAKGLEEAFSEYMKISSKTMAIATTFGWCYMVQLERAVEKKLGQYEIEDGIKNYMLNFGHQDQIENLFKRFKKIYPETKLNLDLLTKGSLNMWRPSMIVTSILD